MSLSNLIKTYELEPVLFNQQYCEFRIPASKVFLKNLRLANLGLTTTGASGFNAPLEYADNVGVFQIIQNLYLYHNNQVLCQIQGVDEWMAFQNTLYSNEDNKNKIAYVAKTNWGFEFNDDLIQASDVGVESTINTNNSENQPSLIDLSKVLSFLDKAPYLNTGVMPQLRVVIEFKNITPSMLNYSPVIPTAVSKTNPAVIDFGKNATALGFVAGQTVTGNGFGGTGWTNLNAELPVTAVVGNNVTITIDSSAFSGPVPIPVGGFVINNFSNCTLQINRPYLLLDELYTADLKNFPFSPFKYGSIQMQQIPVGEGIFNVNQRLNAWNNKKLVRLLMVNKSANTQDVITPPYGNKGYRSIGMWNENFQFTANGMQIVPNQGINTDALKQFYFQNAWISDNDVNKVINLPQGGSDIRNLLTSADLYYQSPAQWIRNTNLAGSFSYGGVRIADAIDQQNISDLNMIYTRGQFPNMPNPGGGKFNLSYTTSAKALTLLIYGEVEEEIIIQNGEVMIVG